LKKLIKQLSLTPTIQAQSRDEPEQPIDPRAALQANKATFFWRLERELEKVNNFYLQKQEELELRLKTLLDKKKHLQARTETASKNSSTFIALEEGFQQFGIDLSKLQQFAEVNNTAFSKILKKWDKTAKSRSRELYLSRAVEVQPCFNREAISELSDQANMSLLDLAAWAEGENIHFDRPSGERNTNVASVGSEERDADSQFLTAVTSGGTDTVRDWIVRLKAAPNVQERMTRVFLAAIADAPEASLATLLETGLVNLQFEDEINERNCLHEAAISGRSFVITIALREGVSVSSVDVYGRIPLHYASMHGHVEILKMLVDSDKATVNTTDHDRYTPLIHAILQGNLKSVETLLAYPIRIDPEGEADHIPLNLACQHGAVKIIELLLKYRPQILADAEGLYPQHWVAKSGLEPELLLMLKEYGADLDETDKINQWTPLFHAASEGHVACLEILLKSRVKPDILDEKRLSAMYYAAWEGHLGCMALLEQVGGSLGLTHPPASAASQKRIASRSPEIMSMDQDGIPDLSLPPPILPFRRYGHNFLDSKTFVQLKFEAQLPSTDALVFYDEGKYPTARLTISSKVSDFIPRNLMLPLAEDSRIISFQVDSLESFAIDFDIYPTFGAKMIARTIAPASTFHGPSSTLASPNGSASGHCCLPLFDPRLRAIGQISFTYQIIYPFIGTPLEITHFATYWKATSHVDSHLNSLVTGSSLSGEYIRIPVQLTSDGIPVLAERWNIDFESVKIPISRLTFDELVTITRQKSGGISKEDLKRKLEQTPSDHLNSISKILQTSVWSLKEILTILSPEISLDIHVLYPQSTRSLESSVIASKRGTNIDLNTYVDAILRNVFDHARDQKDSKVDFLRSIIFSSFNADICAALNWKQPNYPVFFCNDLGRVPPSDSKIASNSLHNRKTPDELAEECGRLSTSVKEAVRIAQSNNLMGLICCSTLLVSNLNPRFEFRDNLEHDANYCRNH
jgi:CDK inhibitor PHO81